MAQAKVCLVASEVAPFAKTGGLADMVTGLGRYLAAHDHEVRLVMPLYRAVRLAVPDLTPVAAAQHVPVVAPLGPWHVFSAFAARLPDSPAEVLFVDCPELYDRDWIYRADGDDHARFGLLCRATLEICQRLGWAPDVVHCNDWHAALIPLYLRTLYSWDALFRPTRTLLTIHNIHFQGVFGASVLDELGLRGDQHLVHQDDLRHGRFNFLRTGVLWASRINTVSRTYAREILTAEHGAGLEPDLLRRGGAVSGIVNGVDYGDWDPAHDVHIGARYTVDDLGGKAECKRALRAWHGLTNDDSPLLGIVSRLTWQKGFELLPDILPTLLRDDGIQLVVLGSGEERYESFFQWLRDQFPTRVGFYRGFHNELAHQIEAGADMFLMPSRYEPCGLNQMYSLRYGTVPIVRRTGGLADTVEQFDETAGTGTGFTFGAFTAPALLDTIRFALRTWRQPAAWQGIVRRGMTRDFSWQRQGPEYVALYRALIG